MRCCVQDFDVSPSFWNLSRPFQQMAVFNLKSVWMEWISIRQSQDCRIDQLFPQQGDFIPTDRILPFSVIPVTRYGWFLNIVNDTFFN
jgi:hypothetical protein